MASTHLTTVNPSPTQTFCTSPASGSASIDSKWQPFFVALAIVGALGLVVAACASAGIGVQQQWWASHLIDQVNQTNSLISFTVGTVAGSGCLILGIIGFSKASQRLHQRPPNSNSEHLFMPQEILDIDSASRSALADICSGKLCITSQTMGGYIGTETGLFPPYLKDFTLEDGSALPLSEQDLFVEIHIFEPSSLFVRAKIPTNLYLPTSLLIGKKDGDALRLKYNNELIELTIAQQSHGLKFAKGTLEEVLSLHRTYVQSKYTPNQSFFGKHSLHWYYNLEGGGKIYKFEANETTNNYHLRENPGNLRQLINPEYSRYDILPILEKTALLICAEFPSFQPTDFEVILNPTHLVIYARYEDRNPGQLSEVEVEYTGELKPKICSKESIMAVKWGVIPGLENLSFEKMKDRISSCSSCLEFGMLQFAIPLA